MSPNNEYVSLLKYAIHLQIDKSMFPTVWAVLSILLDTQDSNLEYVKFLQEEYNRHYEHRSRKYMEKSEKKSIANRITCMMVLHMILIEFQITVTMA